MSLVAYASDSEDSLEGLSDAEEQVDPPVHEKSDSGQIGTSGNQDRVMNKNYEKELLENAENAGRELEQIPSDDEEPQVVAVKNVKKGRLPQYTLAKYGFSRKITSKSGVNCSVEIPIISPAPCSIEKNIPCMHCDQLFRTKQGLGVHVKCAHLDVLKSMKGNNNFLSGESSPQAEIEKPSQENDDVEQLSEEEELQSKDVNDNAGQSVKKTRGSSKRKIYTLSFKADTINDYESGMARADVGEKYGVSVSLISKWYKDKEDIVNKAKTENRKIFKRRPKTIRNRTLYEKLYEEFSKARELGKCVGFNWLFVKAKKIKQAEDGGTIGKHVVRSFVSKYNIKMRRKQRNKKLHKESFRQDVMKFHANTREKLIKTGASDCYDAKWGRFLPNQRFNVDQSPLPFAIARSRTYEEGRPCGESRNHKVWISQPGSGLEKRQCTLQIVFRPEGKQPRICIVFRGKGRISEDERENYHKDVDVLFQDCAWVDTDTSLEWINTTFSECVKDLDRFVLFCDNLSAQTTDVFKEAIAKLGGVVWFVPPNTTDLTQPVNAGYAQIFKMLIKKAQDEWLEDGENCDKWYGCGKFSAKERRLLICDWVGKAYNKLLGTEYNELRRRTFQKTGCLITADGSEDHLITPEGLDNYIVPGPNLYNDPVINPPIPQTSVGEQDGLNEYASDSDDAAESGEEENVLSDDSNDRDFAHGCSGKKLKIHYDNGWFVGVVSYYNRKLKEYKVEFQDGSVDYVPESDVGSTDVILL